jgi:menaquinone-dependent protoporphyrinogen oxidase
VEGSILVAYGTWAGSTAEVAEAVAKGLRRAGGKVDVRPAGEIDELEGYGAVVLGTGVRAGRVHGDVKRFLRKHRARLAELPFACFVVCLTMKEDTGENRATAAGFIARALREFPKLSPVGTGLFGGVMPSGDGLARLSFAPRLLARMMKSQAGDFRNWAAIEEWVEATGPLLSGNASRGQEQ